MASPGLVSPQWRISSFSGNDGTCVEIATLPNGRIAVRNSNDPHAGMILFTHAEMNIWINALKAGEFDTHT